MRIPVASLLLIALALPLVGEDANERTDLRGTLLSTLQQLQSYDGSLTSSALAADLPVEAKLMERLHALHADLTKRVTALKDPASDLAATKQALETANSLLSGLSRISNQFSEYASLPLRYSHADDVPQHKEYLTLMRERMAAAMAAASTGEESKEEPAPIVLRRQRLELALSLVEGERTASENHTHLDRAQPPLTTFATWCGRTRNEMATELAKPVTGTPGEQEQQLAHGRELVNERQRLLWAWLNLLDVEEQLHAAVKPTEPGGDGALAASLRANLDKQLELARERVQVLDTPLPHDDATQMRLERIDHDLSELAEASGRLDAGVVDQLAFTTAHTTIVELIAKGPETLRKEMTARLDDISGDHTKALAKQLKALSEHDRVDTIEAEGELGLVVIRLELLQQDVESEAELFGNEAAWRGQEQNPALRDLVKRYQEARKRQAKARTKHIQTRIAVSQVQHRITLLQLKEELTNNQLSETEEAFNTAHTEIEQLNQALIQAAAEAANGRRAKDAKDADRIPLKDGADNF